MKRSYHRAFELVLRHEYYQETGTGPFTLEPTTECARHLRNLGLVTRPTADGLICLYESAEDAPNAKPLRPLTEGLTLRFLLRATEPELMNYVVLPPGRGRSFFLFGNRWDQLDGEARLLLSNPTGGGYASINDRMALYGPSPTLQKNSALPRERVQITDQKDQLVYDRFLVTYNKILSIPASNLPEMGRFTLKREDQPDFPFYIHQEAVTRGVDALIELYLGDQVPPAARLADVAGTPLGKTLALVFKQPQTTWRYFVIPRNAPVLDHSRLKIEADLPHSFSANATETLGGETAYLFKSDNPMPLGDRSISNIRLLTAPYNADNFKTQIPNLPNPRLDALTFQDEQAPFFSNIYIYV